jgi:hypothetical protein
MTWPKVNKSTGGTGTHASTGIKVPAGRRWGGAAMNCSLTRGGLCPGGRGQRTAAVFLISLPEINKASR